MPLPYPAILSLHVACSPRAREPVLCWDNSFAEAVALLEFGKQKVGAFIKWLLQGGGFS